MKMARYFSFVSVLALVLLVSACGEGGSGTGSTDSTTTGSDNTNTATASTGGTIVFDTTFHNFGTIKEGEIVEHTFKFRNTGTGPITVRTAQASCGCTTPEWTQNPVQPGGEGFVKVGFKSAGKVGSNRKQVTVVTDQPNPDGSGDPLTIKLEFTVEVTAAS
jgi:hypothetical protein